MNTCKYCLGQFDDSDMDVSRHGRPSRSICKRCRYRRQYESHNRYPKQHLVNWARHRAKVNGWPFDLKPTDFEIPHYCPAIGIELKRGKGKLHDASPTLDRIDPDFGYVRGNVVVISYKANRMKNNASLNELKSLTSWMKAQTIPRKDLDRDSVTTNTPNASLEAKIESELRGDAQRARRVIDETVLVLA